jgi:hypothetical protein
VCSCVISCLCEGFTTCFPVFSRMVPACSFYSLEEVQGYRMLVCGRSLPGKQPEGLGGSYPVASWSVL